MLAPRAVFGRSWTTGPVAKMRGRWDVNDMTLSGQDVRGNPRLEICRQGLDEDVVMPSAFRRTD